MPASLIAHATHYLKRHQLVRRADRLTAAHPRTLFAGCPEPVELWAFTHGRRDHVGLWQALPKMPPAAIQERFTGRTGDDTLHQAFRFVSCARRMAQRYGRPVQDVLDFGCGWGRIARFLLRDTEPGHLWGLDCLPEMVELCRQTNPHAGFAVCHPLPPTQFADATFDLIVAYSVFSHLSEPAHLAWLAEFRRLLRPGGLIVVTTRGRDYIELADRLRQTGDTSEASAGARSAFHDTVEALRQFDAGAFVYSAVGGGDGLDSTFFGEACVPEAYVARVWPTYLEIVDMRLDQSVCDQAIIVARRR